MTGRGGSARDTWTSFPGASGAVRGYGAPRPPAVTRIVLSGLRSYKRWVSPRLPRTCRFSPTCSEYAALAIAERGLLRGGAKAAARLLRCQPFHPGGIDLP